MIFVMCACGRWKETHLAVLGGRPAPSILLWGCFLLKTRERDIRAQLPQSEQTAQGPRHLPHSVFGQARASLSGIWLPLPKPALILRVCKRGECMPRSFTIANLVTDLRTCRQMPCLPFPYVFCTARELGGGELACLLGDRKDERATRSRAFVQCPLWLAQAQAPKAGGRPRPAHPGRGPSGPRRQSPPLHVVGDVDRPRPAWFPSRVTQQLRRGHLLPNVQGGRCLCTELSGQQSGEKRDISVAAQPCRRDPSRSQEDRWRKEVKVPTTPGSPLPSPRGSIGNR